jgi:hypothetical protein
MIRRLGQGADRSVSTPTDDRSWVARSQASPSESSRPRRFGGAAVYGRRGVVDRVVEMLRAFTASGVHAFERVGV